MAKITKIPEKISAAKVLNVAAYCRVSTPSEKQEHSLANQISYYNELIQSTPGWNFAGVYYDEGISGRSTKREGFQDLMKKCEAGDIDLIITKSISRFSRNTVDLLEAIRALNQMGVEVRFERECISTFSNDGELLLTLLASFAQAEIDSLSENIRWAIQKGFQEGKAFSHMLYGYTWEKGSPEIIESEAEVIRFIYDEALKNKPARVIADELNKKGIKRRNGEEVTVSFVDYIFTQDRYTGSEVFQKYYQDPKLHRRVKNDGVYPMYLVEDSLPPILDKKVYEEVKKRQSSNRYVQWAINKGFDISCFSRKLQCGKCGRNLNKGYNNNKRDDIRWTCRGRIHYKDCDCERIEEKHLKELIAEKMEIENFNEELFTLLVKKVIINGENDIQLIYKEESDGRENYSN